ncbi:MAG: TolC family protein [Kofleriaceae bacterium]|nr:TolC family protein [Kofleriaceae bacterium]
MDVDRQRLAPVIAAAVCLVTATGCRLHDVKLDPPPPIAVPAAYGTTGGDAAAPDRWWTVFEDPGLDAAIDRALADNLDLAAAWARLEQAGAILIEAGSAKLPEINATLSAARQKNRFVLPEPTGELTVASNSFQASLGAAYEVDLWKKVGSGAAASERDLVAARDGVEAIAMTLAASVTEAWLDARWQKARRALLTTQLELNGKSLDILETQFREGLGSALDVYQQRSLVSATRAQLDGVDLALDGLYGRLAALLAITVPEAAALLDGAPEALPAPPPVPAVGVPASLLERRPDVRAARRQVEAADYRVAVAVADRLPGLRLQAALSLGSQSLVDLIKTPLYSLLASVTAPLFDHGRRAAEVDRTEAVVKERLAGYGKALLTAMIEVDSALIQEAHQQALIAELTGQQEIAAAMVREARTSYREGQIDYLPVLNAIQAEQAVALNILQAQRTLLSLRVTLYRALGGTWTSTLAAPGTDGASGEPR